MLKFVDSLMHFTSARHTKIIYVSKFQVYTITDIEVIRRKIKVIGVNSDLNQQKQ